MGYGFTKRSEAASNQERRVAVNGQQVKSDKFQVAETRGSGFVVCRRTGTLPERFYYLLNKPAGVISCNRPIRKRQSWICLRRKIIAGIFFQSVGLV